MPAGDNTVGAWFPYRPARAVVARDFASPPIADSGGPGHLRSPGCAAEGHAAARRHADVQMHGHSVVDLLDVTRELDGRVLTGKALLVPVERDESNDALDLARPTGEPLRSGVTRARATLAILDEAPQTLGVVITAWRTTG